MMCLCYVGRRYCLRRDKYWDIWRKLNLSVNSSFLSMIPFFLPLFLPPSIPSSLHIKFWFHRAKLLWLNAPNIRHLTHEDGKTRMAMVDDDKILFSKCFFFHEYTIICVAILTRMWKIADWHFSEDNNADEVVRMKKHFASITILVSLFLILVDL